MQVVNHESNLAAASEETFVLHFNMIGKGQTPDEVLQIDFHITVTPDGDVSSFHDHFRLKCPD